VVTFLLTDIEGSTALWDAHPAGMARALEMHDELFESAVRAAGGNLLKARGEGDSTFSVFERPTGALTAALEIRRALERTEWPEGCRLEVRFAVHMGEVNERDGDYYGTAVNRAGRLRSLAVGGQVLVSHAVTEVVADHLPEDASLLDLGEQELRGLTRPERVWALVDAFRPVREALGGLCPYKGLLAFQAEDSDVFFGREALVATLLGRLAERHRLVVVGASGSGKSSVARAGVVGGLRGGALLGSGDWRSVIVTPGEQPSARLAAELSEAGARGGDLSVESFRAVAGDTRLVVVIDQMEELFTNCRDPGERARFVDAVLDATEQLDGRVLAVGALRADFYGHCAAIPRLAAALSESTALLGPMDDRELARAIEAPAQVAGLRLEPGLVELMLRDLAREPGSLPLLSHALLETWRRRSSRTLTLAGYEESGGVRGAIAHTAETVWNAQLTPEQRTVARRVFLRLTELGEGTEDTRRRVARAELVSGADAPVADDVLAALADARLVTVGEGTVEVAHEALIREWPRLRGWLDDDRDALRIHRHLTRAAAGWDSVGRDVGELYRGPRLAAVRDWLAGDEDPGLNELEAEFVAASTAQEDTERAAAEQEAAARERQNRRLRRLIVGVAIALVVALVAAGAALNQRNRADDEANRARAASVTAEVDRVVAELPALIEQDRTLAALLATQASRLRPSAATRGGLLAALTAAPQWRATAYGGHDGYSWTARFPDGRRAVATGRNGAEVWDVGRLRRLAGFSSPGTVGVTVSPDGERIATGSDRGMITVRNASSMRPVGRRLDLGMRVADVDFLSGDRLAAARGQVGSTDPATPDNAARIWDLSTGLPVGAALGGHAGTVNTIAVSPDRALLATGGNDGRIVLHDARSGDALGAPFEVGAPVYDVAFSPDGASLAAGAIGGAVRVFDVASRQPRASVPTSADNIPTVTFTDDGRRIVTAGNVVQVRDSGTLAPVGPPILTQHTPSTLLALTGDELAVTGFDGTVSRWAPFGGAVIADVIRGSPAAGGTFSPDGSRLAVSGYDDTVALYDARDRRRIATLSIGGPGPRPPLSGATPAAFTPDDRTVEIGNRLGEVQPFSAESGAPAGPPITTGIGRPISSVAFAPDRELLVAASNDINVANGARVVDGRGRVTEVDPPMPFALATTFRTDGRRLVVTTGVGGASGYPVADGGVGTGRRLDALGTQAETAAFSPDGKLLAVGTQNGKIRFYDARTLERRGGTVSVSNAIVATLAYSGDSRLLVSQDLNMEFRLVDVRERATVGDPLPTAATGFGLAGFAPDGRRLALPDAAGTTLWDLDVDRWRREACILAGRDLTRAEWERYFASAGDYRETCRD
jgi:WD40 repeat protein/class 3 adenylate cyclase